MESQRRSMILWLMAMKEGQTLIFPAASGEPKVVVERRSGESWIVRTPVRQPPYVSKDVHSMANYLLELRTNFSKPLRVSRDTVRFDSEFFA